MRWPPCSLMRACAALRLRTDGAKRFKSVDRAIAVIWKMLMVAESRFRRLKAVDEGRTPGHHLQGWNRHRIRTGEGRRLISFTHILT